MTSALSRRSLLGAAWSAPVIAVAIATPAAAASGSALAFSPSVVLAGTARRVRLAGTATAGIEAVALRYPAGFGGPPTVSVVDGAFSVPVDCPAVSTVGVVIAAVEGSTTSVSVATDASPPGSGTVNWRTTEVRGSFDVSLGRWVYPEVTGSVSVPAVGLPSVVELSYSLQVEGPAWAAVSATATPGVGTFTVSGVSGSLGSGTVEARPAFNAQTTYTPATAPLTLR